jgi:hypothetical protein
MFQVEQNLVHHGENEENPGETQNEAQPELGAPSNSDEDLVPIIGIEIQEDLHQPAVVTRDSDPTAMVMRDLPAQTMQGQVSSSANATPIEEGSSME